MRATLYNTSIELNAGIKKRMQEEERRRTYRLQTKAIKKIGAHCLSSAQRLH